MMLTDQELQSLRNLGNQCERAASEIYSLRAALTQKRAEYEDLKQTMHNMARNHALQLEAAEHMQKDYEARGHLFDAPGSDVHDGLSRP